MEYDLLILGGGASGLMAARSAAALSFRKKRPISILVVEGNQKLGKKLLATGNGRCNLSNLRAGPGFYHGDIGEGEAFLQRYPFQKIQDAFYGLGLLTESDSEGRVYPKNYQAAAVLQVLRYGCEELGVDFRCGFPVTAICKKGDSFVVTGPEGEKISAGRLILSAGGPASPAHSCLQNGEKLAASLGHKPIPFSPSLTPLRCAIPMVKALKGIRAKGVFSLMKGETCLYQEQGEVMFSGDALSGIALFNASSYLPEDEKDCWIAADFVPSMTVEEIMDYGKNVIRRHKTLSARQLFSGLLNLRLGEELLKTVLPGDKSSCGEIGNELLKQAAKAVKCYRFPVQGKGTFQQAQVSAGGVPLSQIDMRTMESRKTPGLYFTGELLNINGDCGGFNLHWAWGTGICAGENAAAAAMFS